MPISDYTSALVTGASSGIGEAVVRTLCARGVTVHAVARRADRLERLAAATGCQTHRLDLLDTDALYETLGAIECDILVNNAGMGRGFDHFHQATRDDIDRVIDTNVTAAIHVLRATTPGMAARKRGHVVNIGSVAGLHPLPVLIYGASKGAVHMLSQNLRLELKGTGVRCTEICPARVRTEFFDVALDDAAQAMSATEGLRLLEPGDIADAVVYAIDAPWHVNVSTIEISPTEQWFGGLGFDAVPE